MSDLDPLSPADRAAWFRVLEALDAPTRAVATDLMTRLARALGSAEQGRLEAERTALSMGRLVEKLMRPEVAEAMRPSAGERSSGRASARYDAPEPPEPFDRMSIQEIAVERIVDDLRTRSPKDFEVQAAGIGLGLVAAAALDEACVGPSYVHARSGPGSVARCGKVSVGLVDDPALVTCPKCSLWHLRKGDPSDDSWEVHCGVGPQGVRATYNPALVTCPDCKRAQDERDEFASLAARAKIGGLGAGTVVADGINRILERRAGLVHARNADTSSVQTACGMERVKYVDKDPALVTCPECQAAAGAEVR